MEIRLTSGAWGQTRTTVKSGYGELIRHTANSDTASECIPDRFRFLPCLVAVPLQVVRLNSHFLFEKERNKR